MTSQATPARPRESSILELCEMGDTDPCYRRRRRLANKKRASRATAAAEHRLATVPALPTCGPRPRCLKNGATWLATSSEHSLPSVPAIATCDPSPRRPSVVALEEHPALPGHRTGGVRRKFEKLAFAGASAAPDHWGNRWPASEVPATEQLKKAVDPLTTR